MTDLSTFVPPRVIATDLDGTLLHSDGSLSDRTRAAILRAEAAGITTVFVTARPPRWLDSLAYAVGPHGTVLCGNGAFVYDVPTKTVTEQYPLADLLLRELLADLRHAVPDITFAVEGADGLGREEAFVYRSEQPGTHTVGTLAELTSAPVGKLLGRCESLDSAKFLELVMTALGGRAELGYSGASGLAEITAPGVTKAAGLQRWCDARGVGAHEVWAFGDMPNDLPMLHWAGTSFAVGNAHADVLAIAQHVCPSNNDDGVAHTLEILLQGVSE
ncbi:MAG: HAD-IIB family hydrolase [Kineosporiaceae bacterium]|nr:HAD-IIB family hydrolase [Aeromicrobium sp.]